MYKPKSFVLESIILFEACLLQFSHYAAAATSSSNLSVTNVGCTGCTISAGPTILSYPSAVSDVTQRVTATVIPYITQYDNVNITSYSTLYASGASGQTAINSPTTTPLIWTTLGTTLTYPTTYLAFPSPVAGVSRSFSSANSFCYASLTAVKLDATDIAHLIFPSSTPSDHDRITASVVSFLDTLPTISAQVSPYKPSQCSPYAGPVSQSPLASSSTSVAATNAPASSVAAVTHTSVQFLITQGQAVITRSPGTAQPQTSPQTTPQGANGIGNGGSTTTPKPPVLTVGGTTITAGPSGAFTVGGKTLTPGGSVVVVDGTTISLATGGSAAVVNGHTSTLAGAAGSSSTTASNVGSVGGSTALRIWISGAAVGTLGLLIGLFL